jgi:cullin-associated NEDD8-dissociated protein 1
LVAVTLKQVQSKNIATRQQAFILLKLTNDALGGGLEGEAKAVCTAASSALQSVDSGTSSTLPVAALAFLATFFRHHSARIYAPHLKSLVPAITRCMKDTLQPITFEAFAAASSLAQSLRPLGSSSPLAINFSEPIKQLSKATIDVLSDSNVDGEVRERALDTLGHLLVHEGDALTDSYEVCLPLITARLGAETTAHTAVQVIGRVAASPLCKGPDFDSWLLEVLPQVVVSLRKMRRGSGKNAEFACLQALLHRIGSDLPLETAEALVSELVPFADAPPAIATISLVLQLQPGSRSTVTAQFSPKAMELVKSPSLHPQLVDALAAFFGTYAAGEAGSADGLVGVLINNLPQQSHLPDATQGGTAIYAAAARCIGSIIAYSPASAASVLAPFEGAISVSRLPCSGKTSANGQSGKGNETDIYFALLCIGEIGRTA